MAIDGFMNHTDPAFTQLAGYGVVRQLLPDHARSWFDDFIAGKRLMLFWVEGRKPA